MDPADDAETFDVPVPSAGYEHEILRSDNVQFTSDEIEARRRRVNVKPSGRIASDIGQGRGGEEEKDYQQQGRTPRRTYISSLGTACLGQKAQISSAVLCILGIRGSSNHVILSLAALNLCLS